MPAKYGASFQQNLKYFDNIQISIKTSNFQEKNRKKKKKKKVGYVYAASK